jgi:serine/threonine protein kinase
MEQGTLFTHLKLQKKLSEYDAANKIRYISEAVKVVHDLGIAHRDIKP